MAEVLTITYVCDPCKDDTGAERIKIKMTGSNASLSGLLDVCPHHIGLLITPLLDQMREVKVSGEDGERIFKPKALPPVVVPSLPPIPPVPQVVPPLAPPRVGKPLPMPVFTDPEAPHETFTPEETNDSPVLTGARKVDKEAADDAKRRTGVTPKSPEWLDELKARCLTCENGKPLNHRNRIHHAASVHNGKVRDLKWEFVDHPYPELIETCPSCDTPYPTPVILTYHRRGCREETPDTGS